MSSSNTAITALSGQAGGEANTKSETVRKTLWAMYEDATSRFISPGRDITAGLTILRDLIEMKALISHPLLHAMTHALIAVNTPYTIKDSCGRKMAHLDKANDILKGLRTEHGAECQGCMFVEIRARAGMAVDEEDGSECVGLSRLARVCNSEMDAVGDFNWNGGSTTTKMDWAAEGGDVEMPDLIDWTQ